LVLDYGVTTPVAWRDMVPAAIVIAILLTITLEAWRKHRPLAFLGTWWFVVLAPTSTIVPIATEVAAERRVYLPLAALTTLAVLAVWRFGKSRPALMAGLLVACASALAVLTVQRNAEYHSRTFIWQTVLDRRPQGRAHYNLGIELRKVGRKTDAIEQYRLALADAPEAHYALGFELGNDGNYADAVEHLREYVRLKPEDLNVLRAYNLLGRSLMAEGKLDEAADAFRETIARDRRNADAYGGLADALLQQDRVDEAIEAYRRRNTLPPEDPNAHYNLGLALAERQRRAEALAEFEAAAAMSPSSVLFQWMLAHALAADGRLDQATARYRRAIELAPDDPELRAEADAVRRAADAQKK
jgi:tetratricopeptide (TPR) repeat protein